MASEQLSFFVPESPERQDESQNNIPIPDQDVEMVADSFCEESMIVAPRNYRAPATPPGKSILKPSGYSTPVEERKRVSFYRRSLSAANLTAACSPAFENRILRDDMADATFFLEKSMDKMKIDNSSFNTPGSSTSGIPRNEDTRFRISSYINKFSTSRRSISYSSSLDQLGLASPSKMGKSPRGDISTSTREIFLYDPNGNDLQRMVLLKGRRKSFFSTPPSRISTPPATNSNGPVRTNYFATPPAPYASPTQGFFNCHAQANHIGFGPSSSRVVSQLTGFPNYSPQINRTGFGSPSRVASSQSPGFSNCVPRFGTSSPIGSSKLEGSGNRNIFNGITRISKLK